MLRRLLLVFLLPCLAAWVVAFVWQPLERHQAEEYVELAQAPAGESSLFRPPGYVAFLRGVGLIDGGLQKENYRPIYLAQGLLLGLAAVGMLLVAQRWLQPMAATLLGLALGLHPLGIILAGYVHYDMLHLALLVWFSYAVQCAWEGKAPSFCWAAAAGILGALTTLTRPMTLIFPGVLILAIAGNHGGKCRRAWAAGGIFLAAMLLTLAPRTWSNYQRTGKFIPINAQTGAALWPMTEAPLHPTSENFPWVALWEKNGAQLLTEKLGASAEDKDLFMRQPVEVDAVLRARAAEQLRAQPAVYFNNVLHNALFFWTGDSRQIVRAFLFYQIAEHSPPPRNAATAYFVLYTACLHGLAFAGLALAAWRKERALIGMGTVFLTLWVAHSLVYLDARYLYAELPFLIGFASYGLREMLPKRWSRDMVAAGGLLGLSFLGLWLLLLGPTLSLFD